MKRITLLLSLAALVCVSCYPTRIVTVSPDPVAVETYRTTVSIPKSRMVTTMTQTVTATEDISLHLDLQAVAAAFAQSKNVQEFEYLLNNASYMLSNLDLNYDGYVDYLRVVETMEGYAHVFVIQSVLAPNVFQDVATIVAEVSRFSQHVELIGHPYIYGPNYYVRPTFYMRPAIYDHLLVVGYKPWISPWYWNHYPSCYKRPAPIIINHYHAYVTTFMTNHRYCREVTYPTTCHYPNYDRVSKAVQRNDYSVANPGRSFVARSASSGIKATNARDIQLRYSEGTRTDVKTTATSREASSIARSASNPTSRSSSAASSSKTASTARSASNPSSSTASSSSSGSRSSASSSTSTSSSSARSASNPASSSSSARPSCGTSTASTSSSTSKSSGTSTARSSSTTVNSRVSNSGSSSTRISTTSSSGSTTTTRRGSTASSGTSTSRSSSSASSSSSSSRSGSTSSSRSGSTSGSRSASSR